MLYWKIVNLTRGIQKVCSLTQKKNKFVSFQHNLLNWYALVPVFLQSANSLVQENFLLPLFYMLLILSDCGCQIIYQRFVSQKSWFSDLMRTHHYSCRWCQTLSLRSYNILTALESRWHLQLHNSSRSPSVWCHCACCTQKCHNAIAVLLPVTINSHCATPCSHLSNSWAIA